MTYYIMHSKYGNCTRLLKIKNKDENRFSGEANDLFYYLTTDQQT